jgi:hypothetical protein
VAGAVLSLLVDTTDVRSAEPTKRLDSVIRALITDPLLANLPAATDFLKNELHVELSKHLHYGIQNFDYFWPIDPGNGRPRNLGVQSTEPEFIIGYKDQQDSFAITLSYIPAGDCITAGLISDIFRKDGAFEAQGGLWYNLIWGPQVIGARSKEVIVGFNTSSNCASTIIIVE